MKQAYKNLHQQAHFRQQVQHVLTLAQKKEVIQWIVIDEEINGHNGLFSRLYGTFQNIFEEVIMQTSKKQVGCG